MDHYTGGGNTPPPTGGRVTTNTQRASVNLLNKLKPSDDTRLKIKTKVEATKHSSLSFLQKLRALSTQMYSKIKERIAQGTNRREDVEPYETVVMSPKDLESDLVDRQVLQRYNVNSPAGPKQGFVPDENLREQRRARRRQRQLKKSKDEIKDASEEKEEGSSVETDRALQGNGNTGGKMPDKSVANPLFREDDIEEDVPPTPVTAVKPRRSRKRPIPGAGNTNPLFAEV